MKFFISGVVCELQVVGSNGLFVCSVEKMQGLLANEAQIVVIHLCTLQVADAKIEEPTFLAQ